MSSRLAVLGLAVLMVAFATGTAYGQIRQGINNPDPVEEIMAWGNGHIIKGELLVQFKQGSEVAAIAGLHGEMGTQFVEKVAEGLDLVRFEEGDVDSYIEAYQSNPNVDYAEPNIVYWTTVTPNDSYWSQQWGPKKIDCGGAWDVHQGNAAHRCAVIDTGMDMDHADLATQYAGGYDYYSGDSNPNDTDGHGTHTAGTVAAKTNNAKGVAGVAWNCKLLIYRAGSGSYLSTSAIVSSVNAARTNGALAISMSFSGPSPSSSIGNALNNAYNAGCVPVAAAGNHGSTAKHYPAAYSYVIGVAASNTSDSRAGFSAYGPWVSVAAPGVNVLSTYVGNQYAYADGTSMACPHVAGAATLLYSKIGGVRTKTNADKVRDALEQTSVAKSWVEFGRIDLDAAINYIAPPGPPTITSVTPAQVGAFGGDKVTVNGTNLGSISQIDLGFTTLTVGEFTVVSSNQVTFPAPMASTLGPVTLTVTNPSGTSNPGSFSYVETDPPKLECPFTVGGGQQFTWTYGAGPGDYALLFLAPNATTFPYKGDDILLNYVVIWSQNLNGAGNGSLTVNVPSGFGGTWFWTQVVTWDGGSGQYDGATNIKNTLLTN
jgi:thermitase